MGLLDSKHPSTLALKHLPTVFNNVLFVLCILTMKHQLFFRLHNRKTVFTDLVEGQVMGL